jgi:hypothetical protein
VIHPLEYTKKINNLSLNIKKIILNTFMSKSIKSQPPQTISPKDAIINLAIRLGDVERKLTSHFSALEKKIGEHENIFTDNTPDMDQITEMFKVLSSKITEQSARLDVVESKNDIVPKKKKGGTVKLNDLEETVGITF